MFVPKGNKQTQQQPLRAAAGRACRLQADAWDPRCLRNVSQTHPHYKPQFTGHVAWGPQKTPKLQGKRNKLSEKRSVLSLFAKFAAQMPPQTRPKNSPMGKRTMVKRKFTVDYEILYASEFDTRPHFALPICTLS